MPWSPIKETREHRERQAGQVKSAMDAVRLARLRYSGGKYGISRSVDDRHRSLWRSVAVGTGSGTGGSISGAAFMRHLGGWR